VKVYKYLDAAENHNTAHRNKKEELKKDYVRRLRFILNTDLNTRNKMQAIRTLAIPILRFSF
jgi:hypothetical protein